MTLVYNFMVLPYFQVEFYGIDAIYIACCRTHIWQCINWFNVQLFQKMVPRYELLVPLEFYDR
jgi:hypothetical protein